MLVFWCIFELHAIKANIVSQFAYLIFRHVWEVLMLNGYLLKDCSAPLTKMHFHSLQNSGADYWVVFFPEAKLLYFKSFFRWSQVFGFNCIRYTKYPDIGVWGSLKCVCVHRYYLGAQHVWIWFREMFLFLEVLVKEELRVPWLIKMLLMFSEEVYSGTKSPNDENLRPHWVLMWLLNYGWIQHSNSSNLPEDIVFFMSMFWLWWIRT